MSSTSSEVAYHSGDEPGFSASNAKFHRREILLAGDIISIGNSPAF